MVSQVFFARYYPEQKYALLSVTLLFGALATLGGLLAGARILRLRPHALAVFMSLSIAGFITLLMARSFSLYLPAFIVASFSVNLLFNVFDNFFMRVVEMQAQRLHIKVLLLNQMLGYILSPLFFSLFFEWTWLCVTVVSALGFVSYYPALRLLHKVPVGEGLRVGKSPPLERKNRLFLTYALLVYTGVYIFLAITEYLLRDDYHYENSSLVCAIFLMVVILISCVVIAGDKSGDDSIAGGRQMVALSLVAATAFILMAQLSTHPAYLIVPCVFLGIGHGLFSRMAKQYANCCEQKTRVISLFNIFQTLASLCAYLATLFTSWSSTHTGLNANTLNLMFIIATTALAALFFTLFARIRIQEGGEMNP